PVEGGAVRRPGRTDAQPDAGAAAFHLGRLSSDRARRDTRRRGSFARCAPRVRDDARARPHQRLYHRAVRPSARSRPGRHRGVRGAQVFDTQIALGGKCMRRIVALVAVLALIAGVSADAVAQAPIKIRFAWQPYNAALFYTPRDPKLFENAGL